MALATVIGAGLIKIGTGTLILDGINTYTGATTVSAGTLVIGDADQQRSLRCLIVAGGTLTSYGIIGGDLMNTAGGILQPAGPGGVLRTHPIPITRKTPSAIRRHRRSILVEQCAVRPHAALAGPIHHSIREPTARKVTRS